MVMLSSRTCLNQVLIRQMGTLLLTFQNQNHREISMPTYKTPDVYVEEISVFPPSVAEVETAIPAFIGYTEIARKNADGDLILKPTKIYSLKDYERYYGYPEDDALAITVADNTAGGFTVSSFSEPAVKYLMYYSVKM